MTAVRNHLARRGIRLPHAPADDGWIAHRGDRCPVPGGTLLDVRYRCGAEQRVRALRLTADWRNGEARFWVTSDRHANDIVAYRPIEEAARG